jgi:hypothetical protein
MGDDRYKLGSTSRSSAVMNGWVGRSVASPGERYASLAYERLVRSIWGESGSGSAAARAVHETAKRMIIVRLEKSIIGRGCRQRPALLGGKDEPASGLLIF